MASYTAGGITIDWDRGLVSDSTGNQTALRAQSLAVLKELHDRAGSLVTKDDLLGKIWPGVVVTEDSLVQCVAELRRAFKDEGHTVIKTLPKRGYIFETDQTSSTSETKNISVYLNMPETLGRGFQAFEAAVTDIGIAVMPFTNMSADAEQEYFTDGLTEDLITDLSNVPGLFVIARNSSFVYKGLLRDARAVARELGVRHILEGSVRRAGNKIRINVQLIDCKEGGKQIWAERFDRELADIFTVQDEVTRRIVEAITGKIQADYNVDKYRPANLEAYDLVVRSRNQSALSRSSTLEAISDLERAVELDPAYPEAFSLLAHSQFRAWNSWGEPRTTLREAALKNALRATSLAPNSANAHAVAANLLMYERRSDEAGDHFKQAFRLSPNEPNALIFYVDYSVFCNLKQEAVEFGIRALRLNPRPPSSYYWVFGFALVANGQYQQAVKVLRHETTYRTASRRLLAAALALSGQREEAHKEGELFMQASPHWNIGAWIETQPLQNEADVLFWTNAYRLAGLPE